MILLYSVLGLALFVGVVALYSPQINEWNERHLLSRGKK